MADETKKDKAVGLAGTIAGLAGLATSIGTAVPGLKKARKRDTSQRAARAGALGAMAGAVGASQTGAGATRGLALREGLRAASQAAVRSADAASTAAAQDEARFVAERDARNERLQSFGQDLAGAAGQIGQGVVDIKAMRAAELQEGGVDPVAAAKLAEQAPDVQAAQEQELQEIPVGPGPTLEQTDQFGEPLPGPTMQLAPPTTAQDAYRRSLGLPDKPILRLAPELEYKLRLQNLMVEEADRLGIPTTQILAQALRNANISPDLGDILQEGTHADVMAQVEEGGY
jgi:hypothetical protein